MHSLNQFQIVCHNFCFFLITHTCKDIGITNLSLTMRIVKFIMTITMCHIGENLCYGMSMVIFNKNN